MVFVQGVDMRLLPKVSLHDHLDGAIRPATVAKLADEIGLQLPVARQNELASWFTSAARGSLPSFLSTFDLIVQVMQTDEALARVAQEYVVDAAKDGVAYAEVRWAPEQHTQQLSLQAACDAVADGIAAGIAKVRSAGGDIDVREIYCALRQNTNSATIAQLAADRSGDGVVGFDLAGPEAGHPASDHQEALEIARESLLPVTLHAGEVGSAWNVYDALAQGGVLRLGHATKLLDDIDFGDDGAPIPGEIAAWVRDRGIVVECCPSSNLLTGALDGTDATLADHPLDVFYDLGIRTTINIDDRVQVGHGLSAEYALVADAMDLDLADLEMMTLNAADGAFISLEEREALADRISAGWESATQ